MRFGVPCSKKSWCKVFRVQDRCSSLFCLGKYKKYPLSGLVFSKLLLMAREATEPISLCFLNSSNRLRKMGICLSMSRSMSWMFRRLLTSTRTICSPLMPISIKFSFRQPPVMLQSVEQNPSLCQNLCQVTAEEVFGDLTLRAAYTAQLFTQLTHTRFHIFFCFFAFLGQAY